MLKQVRGSGLSLPLLHGEEVVDLLSFLGSLRYVEPVGSPFLGGRLFSERGCAHCHGLRAEGSQLGPGIRQGGAPYTAVSFATALWRHGPKMQARAEEQGIRWPSLEATDVGDLISFLNAPERAIR